MNESSCGSTSSPPFGVTSVLNFDHVNRCAEVSRASQVARWKESTCQLWGRRRGGFNPWVGKVLGERKWQSTPEFLPEKSHGQSVVGYSRWGQKKRVRHNLATEHTHAVAFHCCLNFNWPDDIWCGASFHRVIFYLYIYSSEISFKVFDPFF